MNRFSLSLKVREPEYEKANPAVECISVKCRVNSRGTVSGRSINSRPGCWSGTFTQPRPHVGKSITCGGQRSSRRHSCSKPEYTGRIQKFFGDDLPEGPSQPFEGLGSGVIIDAAKGYVLTNNHVINQAQKISIQLNDGREFDAKLIGSDDQSDIALLQIQNPSKLTQITIADSDKLRVGDFAVAVGNPFGLGQTATSGIISALGRSGLNLEGLENFIQTDASINRGNSGGALINLNGELIGINTAILAPWGQCRYWLRHPK